MKVQVKSSSLFGVRSKQSNKSSSPPLGERSSLRRQAQVRGTKNKKGPSPADGRGWAKTGGPRSVVAEKMSLQSKLRQGAKNKEVPSPAWREREAAVRQPGEGGPKQQSSNRPNVEIGQKTAFLRRTRQSGALQMTRNRTDGARHSKTGGPRSVVAAEFLAGGQLKKTCPVAATLANFWRKTDEFPDTLI